MAHFIHIQFAEDGRGTIKLAVMMPTELEVDNRQLSRAVGAGDRVWVGGHDPCSDFGRSVYLISRGGADYAHTTLLTPPPWIFKPT